MNKEYLWQWIKEKTVVTGLLVGMVYCMLNKPENSREKRVYFPEEPSALERKIEPCTLPFNSDRQQENYSRYQSQPD